MLLPAGDPCKKMRCRIAWTHSFLLLLRLVRSPRQPASRRLFLALTPRIQTEDVSVSLSLSLPPSLPLSLLGCFFILVTLSTEHFH